MRHHDILPGYDYCLILDKLETKLPPWKRIYVEDADACSHVLDPSFCQNGFGLVAFNQQHEQKISLFVFGGRRKKFICGIGPTLQCNQDKSEEKLNMVIGLTRTIPTFIVGQFSDFSV